MSTFVAAYDGFYGIVMLGFKFGFCYIISMIVIGFPCTVIESLFKTKISEELQSKLIMILSVILLCYFLFFT